MLKVRIDASTREGKRVYHALYMGCCSGGVGERRGADVIDREIAVLGKLRALGSLPQGVDVDALPIDAIEPYELQQSGELLLTESERKLLRDYVDHTRWGAAMSEARKAALSALDEAEKVDAEPGPAVP